MKQVLYRIFSPGEKNHHLIHDLILKKLKVNRDPRGTLTEMLKTTWKDVYDRKHLPFTQIYVSTTVAGVARDENRWHFHPGGQVDRYVVLFGDVVLVVYDTRESSLTKDTINICLLGESLGPDNQYLILVPPRTLHCFLVVGDKPATLVNFPNRLYDPKEELRIPFELFPLPDGSTFSWEKVIKAYNEYVKD